MSQHMCPHCGYDLLLDAPILIDDFSMMSLISNLWWRETPVPMTASEKVICYTLMKAYPLPVRRSVILERLDSESDGKIIDVYVCRLRKKLRAIGAPNPIEMAQSRFERALVWVP